MKKFNTVFKTKTLAVKTQRGLTLLELLIAMLIGLFLLVGITSNYYNTKKSSVLRDQMSILEENGRTTLEILTNTIQHTGYRSMNLDIIEMPFMIAGHTATSYDCGSGSGQSILANPTTSFDSKVLDNNNGDSIAIAYMGDANLHTDCNGLDLPADCQAGGTAPDAKAGLIYNAFYLDKTNDTLQCLGSRGTDAVTVADGVENMQILYGVNDDNDSTKSVDSYVNAAAVTDWTKVVSIKIGILVRTLQEVKNEPESESFTVLDYTVPASNDRFIRAVFSTTINLRNL